MVTTIVPVGTNGWTNEGWVQINGKIYTFPIGVEIQLPEPVVHQINEIIQDGINNQPPAPKPPYGSVATDKTLTVDGAAADARATGDRFATLSEEIANSNPPMLHIPSVPTGLVIDNCQDVSKWARVLGTISADTTDYIIGSQSIKFDQRIQISFDAQPTAGKQIRVRFKVNAWGDSAALYIYVTGNSFSPYGVATLADSDVRDGKSTVRAGEWVDLVVPLSAFKDTDMSQMETVNCIRLTTYPNNTSADINVQQVSIVDAPSEKGIITFAFDDGFQTSYTKAAPVLAARGISATAYLIPDAIGHNDLYMTEAQVIDLKRRYGWDVECHLGHNTLIGLDAAELTEAFCRCKKWIQERGLSAGEHFAYPGGFFDASVETVAQRYFATARTIDHYSLSGIASNALTIPHRLPAVSSIGNSTGGFSVANTKALIDRVAATNGWLILVFHIIDDEDTSSGMYCTSAALGELADYAIASGATVRTVADVMGG